MPKSHRPKEITDQEMVDLLTTVFGKDIIVDTQQAQYRRERTEKANKDTGGWMRDFGSEVARFVIDLPPAHARQIAQLLRQRMEFSEAYRKKKNRVPPVTELIDDEIMIKVDALGAYARENAVIEPRFSILGRIMDLALAYEADWKKYKDAVVSEANGLILDSHGPAGEDVDSQSATFVFEARLNYNYDAQYLYLTIGDPVGLLRYPEIDKNADVYNVGWSAERIFNKRAEELGIDHLFRYASVDTSGRGEYGEERLMMSARSTEDMWLKMRELSHPPTREKVRTFFLEAIREVAVDNYAFSVPDPKALYDELYALVPEGFRDHTISEADYKIWSDEREKVSKELESKPEYAPWIEMVSSFMEDNKTMGDMIEVLRDPPSGKEDVCEQIKAHVLKMFPLLAAEFEQPSLPQKPEPAQTPQPQP